MKKSFITAASLAVAVCMAVSLFAAPVFAASGKKIPTSKSESSWWGSYWEKQFSTKYKVKKGNVVKVTTKNYSGNKVSNTVVEQLKYKKNHLLEDKTLFALKNGNLKQEDKTVYKYNKKGLRKSKAYYDDKNKLDWITYYKYRSGRLIKETCKAYVKKKKKTVAVVKYKYNQKGKCTSETYIGYDSDTGKESYRETEQYTYDRKGRMTGHRYTVKDAEGRSVRNESYNTKGKITKIEWTGNGEVHTVTYSYDSKGRITGVITVKKDNDSNYTWKTTITQWDQKGNPAAYTEVCSDGSVDEYKFEHTYKNGNLVSLVSYRKEDGQTEFEKLEKYEYGGYKTVKKASARLYADDYLDVLANVYRLGK